MNNILTEIERLEAEQRELVLNHFDHDDAWRLGLRLREHAREGGMPVAIDIRRPSGAVLFHASLPGATADQEVWIARKFAVAVRFEASSALIAARLEKAGVNAAAIGWLPSDTYAPGGGAVPIEVAGAGMVAVITLSGLASEDDHAMAVGGLRALRDDDK